MRRDFLSFYCKQGIIMGLDLYNDLVVWRYTLNETQHFPIGEPYVHTRLGARARFHALYLCVDGPGNSVKWWRGNIVT